MLTERLDSARAELLRRCKSFPKVVIILGSGLANLLKEMVVETEFAFTEIPHFCPITVEGHQARIVVGLLNGVRVACIQGRLHYYEGYSMQEVVFPVRAFAWAGAEVFVLTNASGSLHERISPPSLVLIRDHFELDGI